MPGFSMPNFNFDFSGFNMPQIDLSRLNIPDISKILAPTVEYPMAQVQPTPIPTPAPAPVVPTLAQPVGRPDFSQEDLWRPMRGGRPVPAPAPLTPTIPAGVSVGDTIPQQEVVNILPSGEPIYALEESATLVQPTTPITQQAAQPIQFVKPSFNVAHYGQDLPEGVSSTRPYSDNPTEEEYLAAQEVGRVQAAQEEAAQVQAAQDAAQVQADREEADRVVRVQQEEAARVQAEQEAARVQAEQEATQEAARVQTEQVAAQEAAQEAARMQAEQQREEQLAELGEAPTLELPEFTPSDALFEPPEYTPYELTPYEDFEAPEYDPSQIRGRAQDIASPQTRRLQESLTQALSGTIENPNVRRMIERGALSGYSLGLEDITGAARGQALGEYGQEYEELYDVSTREWETEMRDIQAKNRAGEGAAQINYQRDLTSYAQEMQRAQDAQLIQYETQLKEELANYNAALEEYYAKVEQITTVTEG